MRGENAAAGDHYDQIVAETARWPSTRAYTSADGAEHKLALFGGSHLSGAPSSDALQSNGSR